jgi:hypothetical protein
MSGADMVTLTCPGCSKTYNVSAQNAGKRGKCKSCGEPLVVPEADWEEVDDTGAPEPDSPSSSSPPVRFRQAEVAAVLESAIYRQAENVSAFLAFAGRAVALLGTILSLVAACVAFSRPQMESVGVAFLIVTAMFVLSYIVTELGHLLVLLFVDLARNASLIRQGMAGRRSSE